jgi:putative membrane protein
MYRALIFTAALISSTAAVSAPRAHFLNDAVKGNYSETVLGRMIQARGATPLVRSYGSMLARDHSSGLAQARDIARRYRIPVSVTLTPEARREQHVLSRLSGRAFDREVRRYMINDHVKHIAEFRAQARSGDRATSRYAAAIVPVM